MIVGPISIGRFTVADSIAFKFTTVRDDTGAPATLATPALKVYENGTDVEFNTGVTLTADYDSKTGLNDVVIDTSSGYTAGKQYTVFISAGTVNSVSHVGYIVGHFALIPQPADIRLIDGSSTLPELAQGVPDTTPTLAKAIMLLYMTLRNQVKVHKDTLLKEIYNNAGTRISKKAISDDGTTYTEGKMSTGA